MLPKYQPLALLMAAIPIAVAVHCAPCIAQQALASRPDKATMQELVKLLGSNDFAKREEAGRRLVAAGEAALEVLQQATTSSDPEVRQRAEACIVQIEHNRQIAKLVIQSEAIRKAEKSVESGR